MSAAFLKAIIGRRSYYSINNTSPITDAQIIKIVEQTITHSPSAFNSQSTRALVLLGAEHEKLWRDIVKPAVKAVSPEETWEASNARLSGFQSGYGTVLFFEDSEVVAALQKKAPLYADRIPAWSEHANGINTVIAWTALEQEGLGANLQHYNPLIDAKVATTWNVPVTWQLRSQLVFGGRTGEPKERAYEPLEKRLIVHGAKLAN